MPSSLLVLLAQTLAAAVPRLCATLADGAVTTATLGDFRDLVGAHGERVGVLAGEVRKTVARYGSNTGVAPGSRRELRFASAKRVLVWKAAILELKTPTSATWEADRLDLWRSLVAANDGCPNPLKLRASGGSQYPV